jgi:peptidyl-prolyl cis-trans isomerase B (cyclophilin B)
MAKNSSQTSKQARAALRSYNARQDVHHTQVTRRARDNRLAFIAGLAVIAIAIGSQAIFSSTQGSPAPTPTGTNSSSAVPPASLSENRVWTGAMKVGGVDLGIQLDGVHAPQAVASTISLVNSGFYTGVSCHRLVTSGIYVLQCGDPTGTGTGGPGYAYGPVENAPSDDVYPAGTLAMARQGNNGNSMGSQFFIVYQDSTIPSDTAGGYTVIGKVTSGLEDLKANVIARGIAAGTESTPAIPVNIDAINVN